MLRGMPSYLIDSLYKQFQFENKFFPDNLKAYSIMSVSNVDVRKSDVIHCISQCCGPGIWVGLSLGVLLLHMVFINLGPHGGIQQVTGRAWGVSRSIQA